MYTILQQKICLDITSRFKEYELYIFELKKLFCSESVKE